VLELIHIAATAKHVRVSVTLLNFYISIRGRLKT